ncbi:Phosphoribosylaminoimidazole-succinocarboxamide synthase [Geodia barretti]|uniref:phosphoribosylaminoimidazolesuccinocarboxamide synthase n=1 Tax=Geodia barretti TaxID=519541 RepID=A0AA35T1L9_GEOBA|nr:Phosphoribosylaminoimidazole-succinocarboxamide synthase [Geodia barretti]
MLSTAWGVLASAGGTNLQAILDRSASGRLPARVGVVIGNNSRSGALARARLSGIPAFHLSGVTHPRPGALDRAITETLRSHGVDLLVLAGYMKKLGPVTLENYKDRIVNIHPALLPAFGGKGMYGHRVHEAVVRSGVEVSGATVHLVDGEYDTGPVILQRRVRVCARRFARFPRTQGCASMAMVLTETRLDGVPLFARGKVRDVYDLGDRLLIVATDRISAFDCVAPNGIPGKGAILTEMSLFWFEKLAHLVAHHLITASVDEYPSELQAYREQLESRSMLVMKADRVDIECVARGYLAGSGWKDYTETGAVCGVQLPDGLEESGRLDRPIFTPATKAVTGHDENISFEQMCNVVEPGLASRLRDLTLEIYAAARTFAEGKGILIADTKFEFGLRDGEVILIDEILSPDSSRFWDRELYAPGRSQDSFDKQFVRDYLETLDWDKTPPAPELPDEIVEKTLDKYRDVRDRLLG